MKTTFKKFANTVLGIVAMAFFFFAFMKPAFAGTLASPTTIQVNREVEVNASVPDGKANEYFMLHTNKVNQYVSVEFRNPGSEGFWAVIYQGKNESYNKIFNEYVRGGDYETGDLILPVTDCMVVFYGGSTIHGTYKINIINDDYPNTFNDARQMNLNTGYEGMIEINNNSEFDMFKFNTDATNSFYSVNIAAKGDQSMYVQVYYRNDETGKLDNGDYRAWKGEVASHIFKLDKNKTYWIKVYNYGYKAPYRLTVNKVMDEAGDDYSGAKKLKLGKNASGSFQADADTDFYSVKTGAGRAYWLAIKNRSGSTGMRITVYARKDDESSKIQNMDYRYIYSGSKQDIKLKLAKKHVYYIKLTGSANGGYTVGLNQSSKTLKKDAPKGFKVNSYSYYSHTYITFQNNLRYDGVEIWRSTRSGGGYKRIKVLPLTSSSGYYNDYGLPKRRKCYYKVRYYVSDGGKKKYGKWSKVKSGYRRY